MALELSETHWPLSYNDHELLIGPLRMVKASYVCADRGRVDVWVYCWNDPGVRERVNEQCRAILDLGRPRYDR